MPASHNEIGSGFDGEDEITLGCNQIQGLSVNYGTGTRQRWRETRSIGSLKYENSKAEERREENTVARTTYIDDHVLMVS